MNKEQFIKTYCHNCGTQRCEGIDTEWFDGCKYKWNLDSMDAAAEIERLEKQILEMSTKLTQIYKNEGRSCSKEFTAKDLSMSEESPNKRYGRWIKSEIEKAEISGGRIYKHYTPVFTCSLCNTAIVGLIHMKYCPDCGAIMDKEQN